MLPWVHAPSWPSRSGIPLQTSCFEFSSQVGWEERCCLRQVHYAQPGGATSTESSRAPPLAQNG
jgi:hypothetical protein